MTPKARRAHWIAAGLFLLPIVLVTLTLNSAFGIGGSNPPAEAAFMYLLLWPLQIPLVVMVVYDLRSRGK